MKFIKTYMYAVSEWLFGILRAPLTGKENYVCNAGVISNFCICFLIEFIVIISSKGKTTIILKHF